MKTSFFYHGSQRWDGPPEIRKARKGQIEHGPGLYLTTSIDTARKYAKGGGVVLRFEIEMPLRWLEDARIPAKEMIRFVREAMPAPKAKRVKVIADIEAHASRARSAGRGEDPAILAGVLVNLLLYYGAVKGEGGPALARYLVERGIDAGHVQTSGEDWVVLFNLDKIVRFNRVSPSVVEDAPRVVRS